MFVTRLISGIIMLFIAYFTIYFSNLPLLILLLILSIIGMYELYKLEKIQFKSLGIFMYIFSFAYYMNLYLYGYSTMIIFPIIVAFLSVTLIFVIKYPKFEISNIMMSFFGFFYLNIPLSFIYTIRKYVDNGIIVVWLIFLSAWGADTLAYCVGKLFGKRKLFPILSPKKSIEGAIGGIVGAGILGFIFAFIFYNKGYIDIRNLYFYPIICFLGAIISIFGDLFASGIKRKYNIKDYGNFIKGHGGVLDRFDSIIFVSPFIYIILNIIQRNF